MQQLQVYIKNYFGISNEKLNVVSDLFQPETIKKGAFYIKKDAYCQKLSFVRNGLFRMFANHEDKEITQWIAGPDYFVADLSSLIFETPATWNIQALTDCELYSISSENYRKIDRLVPEWPQLEKLFIAKCFITMEQRVFSLISKSAEQRYKDLLAMNGELINQVPLQYIASMLGMTPETLSRIRKNSIS